MAKKSASEFLSPAPPNYVWPRCPEAGALVDAAISRFLAGHGFARSLSARLQAETSTEFGAWVDHLIVPSRDFNAPQWIAAGFVEDKKVRRPAGARVYGHPFADLPRVLVPTRTRGHGCAIMVDDIWKFQLAHGLTGPIEGAPFAGYRASRFVEGPTELLVVERRGSQSLVPETASRAEAYARAFERWAARPRRHDDALAGMKETLRLARDMAARLGTGPAAHIFLEGERAYWESRNRAARVQKARQDALGLGWGNHDHHTFRSSRACFPALIDILLALGFKKRERYYAGADAGWGAQIVEQPESGTIIFADVDLAPDEVSVDFSKVVMPELKKPGTVGLWCALHGESMLEAGMHHLEAKFDYEKLREDLKSSGVETMPPFSDFAFLRQAFTKAEMWRVPEARLAALLSAGKISPEAFEQIRAKGAVGSHLENLQRREGFKGFNQKGVSHIIAAVNPERQALSHKAASEAA